MKRILQTVLIALTLMVPIGGLAGTAFAAADTTTLNGPKTQVCEGVSGGGNCGTGAPDLSSILKVVLNVLTVIAGVLAVIMVIIAGMKYITSGGEAQAVASAKKSLTYALVGVVIVAVSQTLVRFVVAKVK